jgi:hypothetical protein
MMEEETRRIIMTVEPATGKITKIEGENKETVEEVKAEDIEKTYQSENGFKYAGTILYARINPRCFYYYIGGRIYKICF